MLSLGKSPEQIGAADLQQLVAGGMAEGDRLEFKRDMYGRDDEGRRELLRDVTAMANHRGGHLLIGVAEDGDGGAAELPGVPPGDHADWIRNLCLTAVEERIIGLNVYDHVVLPSGNIVVVIDVPESANAPHMVTFKGLNQFWKRHGRRKDRMTVDEIREGFVRVLDTRGRIERFLARRDAELREFAEGRCYMVLGALPAYFRGEDVIDTRDSALRQLIGNPPPTNTSRTVHSGQPRPTLDGLQASHGGFPLDEWIEVHRNGYVEFGHTMRFAGDADDAPIRYATIADTEYIISYVALIAALYGRFLPGAPILVRLTFYNCRGMSLTMQSRFGGGSPRWSKDTLVIGDFLVEDVAAEQRRLPKRICDRLWNAFHYDEANVFDAEGNLLRR